MTPSSLTAKIDSYKLVEGEYAEVEALVTTAISDLQVELELLRKSREYIADIRRKLEQAAPPDSEDLQ